MLYSHLKLITLFQCVSTLIFLSVETRAESKNGEESSVFFIQQLDENFPVEEFKETNVKVQTLNELERGSNHSQLLPVSVRDNILRKSGLNASLLNWDQYSKDMLEIRAKIYDPKRLVSAYPTLNKSKLTLFQNLIKKSFKNRAQ